MNKQTGTLAQKKYTLFTPRQLLWLIVPIVIEQILKFTEKKLAIPDQVENFTENK